MITLYIDTHFEKLVIAFFKNEKVVLEKKLNSNKHSENTVSMLEEILKETNVTFDDINEIIVINGPGSFTGVRIGIVIAKIISYTKNIPIKTLSYLEALALNYGEVNVGIKDRNGAFIGEFDKNNNLKVPYYYINNEELNNLHKEIVFEDNISLERVYEYMKDKKTIYAHELKPLYVKKIEALK